VFLRQYSTVLSVSIALCCTVQSFQSSSSLWLTSNVCVPSDRDDVRRRDLHKQRQRVRVYEPNEQYSNGVQYSITQSAAGSGRTVCYCTVQYCGVLCYVCCTVLCCSVQY